MLSFQVTRQLAWPGHWAPQWEVGGVGLPPWVPALPLRCNLRFWLMDNHTLGHAGPLLAGCMPRCTWGAQAPPATSGHCQLRPAWGAFPCPAQGQDRNLTSMFSPGWEFRPLFGDCLCFGSRCWLPPPPSFLCQSDIPRGRQGLQEAGSPCPRAAQWESPLPIPGTSISSVTFHSLITVQQMVSTASILQTESWGPAREGSLPEVTQQVWGWEHENWSPAQYPLPTSQPNPNSTMDKDQKSVSPSVMWDSMDYSPPRSSVHGILQARILEWAPFLSPGDLRDPGIEPGFPALWGDSLPSETSGKPNKGQAWWQSHPLQFIHSFNKYWNFPGTN